MRYYTSEGTLQFATRYGTGRVDFLWLPSEWKTNKNNTTTAFAVAFLPYTFTFLIVCVPVMSCHITNSHKHTGLSILFTKQACMLCHCLWCPEGVCVRAWVFWHFYRSWCFRLFVCPSHHITNSHNRTGLLNIHRPVRFVIVCVCSYVCLCLCLCCVFLEYTLFDR